MIQDTHNQELKVYSATEKRLIDCACGNIHIYLACPNNHAVKVQGHCFIRYCINCYEHRLAKIKKTLRQYRPLFDRTCKHLILTAPRGTYSKKSKRELEDAKRKFFQMLRRKGARIQAVAVFDYGNPTPEDPLDTNMHIHCALNMRFAHVKMLKSMWHRATGDPGAVLKLATNWTKDGTQTSSMSTNRVFKYIARRAAGDFGHGDETKFYYDMGVTVDQYDDLIRGSRVFTFNSAQCAECRKIRLLHKAGKSCCQHRNKDECAHHRRCVSCNLRAELSQGRALCPCCCEELVPVATTFEGHFTWIRQDWIPPPPEELHSFDENEDLLRFTREEREQAAKEFKERFPCATG